MELPPDELKLPECISTDQVIERVEGMKAFYNEVLKLKPLDAARFVERYLLPQYRALQPLEQLKTLAFLRSQLALIRDNAQLRQQIGATPLLYGNDRELRCTADICLPNSPLLSLFGNRFHEPHQIYFGTAPIPQPITDWEWFDLFTLIGVSQYARPSVVITEIRALTARPPRQHREQVEKLFRYLEEHWETYYAKTGLGAQLSTMSWLPADGDDEKWYSPRDLYPRQDKPLVGYVAKILGFADATRPRKSIADALGLPTSVETSLVVKQLLELSRRKESASAYLYRFLNHDTISEEELKPLRGRDVIYAKDRYWKADLIFLSDQSHWFGPYRGYATDAEYRTLLHKLGAKQEPTLKDFADLLHQISAKDRDNLPETEARLLVQAYTRLADAPDELLAPFKELPCALSVAGNEGRALRRPDSVLLQPPQHYLDAIPGLPIAQYEPAGERTLRRLGVRTIQQVCTVHLPYAQETNRPYAFARAFGLLEPAIRRLFHHARRDVLAESASTAPRK